MYGLIGYPLSHSFSKDFFTKKFSNENITGESYHNFPIKSILEFPELIESQPLLKGLNVTIPYKEKILPFLNYIDPDAAEVGAVNTIRFSFDGKKRILSGYNTDTYGFARSLAEILDHGVKVNKALILGTGGASKAVAWSLQKMNIRFEFVSTSSQSAISYIALDRKIIENYELIINTTPLGTFPDIMNCPAIPYDFISEKHILFDLVYNPPLSMFLKKGQERGAIISNGFKMLEYQAVKSWEIWNSLPLR